ncbi:hypothetical protein FGO68_gene14669 [Halteria grandinella]|uniref:RAP domain-containing protein n=1 Tax=Halteria grandinella TaxID=5974 RepID=A0A8J8T4D7_HALGN|nr:hypothetical protein FGO68_gene14669 [Halteria grandinella]
MAVNIKRLASLRLFSTTATAAPGVPKHGAGRAYKPKQYEQKQNRKGDNPQQSFGEGVPKDINFVGQYIASQLQQDQKAFATQSLKSQLQEQVIKTLPKCRYDQFSHLLINMRNAKLFNQQVGEAFVDYISQNLNQLHYDDAAIAMRTLAEFQFLKTALKSKIQSWQQVEAYFINAIKLNNKMLLLSNLSFLETFWSKEFLNFLVEKTLRRMDSEMLMEFYQTRWVSINVTALARLYSCPNLDPEMRMMIQDFGNKYACAILNKLKVPEYRQGDFANDLASIAFQFKKLKLTNQSELYIYLQESLLQTSLDSMKLPSLIQLIQCFKTNYIHSQKLFKICLEKIYQMSNKFTRLELHEFAIVISQLGNFWARQVDAELDQAIQVMCENVLSNPGYQGKYSGENYLHQIEKIFEALINLNGNQKLKQRFQDKVNSLLPTAQIDHKLFVFWCLTIDQNVDGALQVFEKYIKGNVEDIMQEFAKSRFNAPVRQLQMLHALYVLNVLLKEKGSQEIQNEVSQCLQMVKDNMLPKAKQEQRHLLQQNLMKQEIEKLFQEKEQQVTIHEEYDTGFYIVDMYIPELNLIVEIDGITHYSGIQNLGSFHEAEQSIGSNAKTRTKRAVLEKLGYKCVNINLVLLKSKHDPEAQKALLSQAIFA